MTLELKLMILLASVMPLVSFAATMATVFVIEGIKDRKQMKQHAAILNSFNR